MYEFYNPNPCNKRVGDCTIRAISKVLGKPWEDVYIDLCLTGILLCDMPSSNNVWGAYLRSQGFTRHIIPDDGIEKYTVEDFCRDHPTGTYLLALQSHVVAVEGGSYFDTWDSGAEPPIYYWTRKEE